MGSLLVPTETAVQTRLLYGNQPEGEMVMVMTELLRKADESQRGEKVSVDIRQWVPRG